MPSGRSNQADTHLCLQVHLRIPIGIKENDNISRSQVDAETTSTGGEHEDKLVAIGPVVIIYIFLEDEGVGGASHSLTKGGGSVVDNCIPVCRHVQCSHQVCSRRTPSTDNSPPTRPAYESSGRR